MRPAIPKRIPSRTQMNLRMHKRSFLPGTIGIILNRKETTAKELPAQRFLKTLSQFTLSLVPKVHFEQLAEQNNLTYLVLTRSIPSCWTVAIQLHVYFSNNYTISLSPRYGLLEAVGAAAVHHRQA